MAVPNLEIWYEINFILWVDLTILLSKLFISKFKGLDFNGWFSEVRKSLRKDPFGFLKD